MCHWCSYHILASVIYYWTDARQHGMLSKYAIDQCGRRPQLARNLVQNLGRAYLWDRMIIFCFNFEVFRNLLFAPAYIVSMFHTLTDHCRWPKHWPQEYNSLSYCEKANLLVFTTLQVISHVNTSFDPSSSKKTAQGSKVCVWEIVLPSSCSYM